MDPTSRTVLKDGEDGRTIDPIPYTGESEEFVVKITDRELAVFMDYNCDI